MGCDTGIKNSNTCRLTPFVCSKTFHLSFFFTTDQGVGKLLKRQTKLWYLELQQLPLINGTCLQYLHSPKLETLILNNLLQLQEDYVMDAVSNCSRLSVLDLQHSPNISDSSLLAASAILKENLVS